MPEIKKFIILCIIIHLIGKVFIKCGIRYVLVSCLSPNIRLQQIFQSVQSLSIFALSNLHNGQPYSDEHWLIYKITFDSHERGLNVLMTVLVLTLISLMMRSIFIISYEFSKVCPKWVSDLTFLITLPHNFIQTLLK